MPLLLAALCLLPATVSVRMRAQPLSLLLPALSNQLGRRLGVQPALGREWVVIDAKDVEPDALLARIAEVTHAKWVAEGEEIRLRRLPEDDRALQAAEREFYVGHLRNQWKAATKEPYAVAKVAQGIQGHLDRRSTPQNRDLALLLEAIPVRRYLPELLLQLPPDEIFRLKNDEGLLYSSRPRGIQRPFPARTAPVLARLFQDHETFTTIVDRKEFEKLARVRPLRDYGVATRAALEVTGSRGAPGHFALHVRLTLRDDKGESVVTSGLSTYSFHAAPPVKEEDAPVEFSRLTREIESLVDPETEEAPRAPDPDSPAVQAILNPERDGRLTRLWSDVMFALASRENRPLVANLPDTAEASGLKDVAKGRTIHDYLGLLTGSEIRRDGGWLTLRPRFPGPLGNGRTDRQAVGMIVRRGFEGRSIGLAEACDLVARLDENPAVIDWRLPFADQTGGAATCSIGQERLGLDILRHLGPAGRQALYAGRTSTLAALPPAVSEAVRRFFSQNVVFLDYAFAVDDESANANSDWTERLTQEMIAASTLSATTSEGPAFLVRSSPTTWDRSYFGARDWVKYLDDNLRLIPFDGIDDVTQVRLQVMTEEVVDLELRFPNGDRYPITLTGYRINPQSPFLPFEKLPVPVRAHLRKLKDAERGDE